MTEALTTTPYRIDTRVEKYAAGTEPSSDAPTETLDAPGQWFDGDGTPIVDPDRIEELEARVRAREE